MERTERRSCANCVYRATDRMYKCDYLYYTGKSRVKLGYEIKNGSCAGWMRNDGQFDDVDKKSPFVVATGKVRKRMSDMEDQAMAMYKAGQTDKAIAKALGVHSNTIRDWRIKKNLPTLQGFHGHINYDAAKELYDKGMNDAEIAAELGFSRTCIRQWRKRNGLPTKWKGANNGET